MSNEEYKSIIHKTAQLFLTYGIKSVSMDDIARELGKSKKTIYQFIKDKNDLVAKVLDTVISEKDCEFHAIEENPDLNVIERIIEGIKHAVTILRDHNPSTEYDLKKYYPEHYRKLYQFKFNLIYNNIKKNLTEGIEEGYFRDDLNIEVIARLQTGIYLHILNPENDIFTPDDIRSGSSYIEIMKYHFNAIVNEKGRKEVDAKFNLSDPNIEKL